MKIIELKSYYLQFLKALEQYPQYIVESIEGVDDTMGDLIGYQFNSTDKGGYMYFWSCGKMGYHLIDYNTELEIIEDSLAEITPSEFEETLASFINKL